MAMALAPISPSANGAHGTRDGSVTGLNSVSGLATVVIFLLLSPLPYPGATGVLIALHDGLGPPQAEVNNTLRDLVGPGANSRAARRLTFRDQFAIQDAGMTAVADMVISITDRINGRPGVSQDVVLRRFHDKVRSIVDRRASSHQAPSGRGRSSRGRGGSAT